MLTSPVEFVETSYLTLLPSLPTDTAVAEMAKANASFALVCEGDQLQGIITERDVVRIVSSQQYLNALVLSEVMTQNPIVIPSCEIADIFQASQLFSRHRVRHLPIVDEREQLLGVMTPQSVQNSMKPEFLLRCIRTEEAMVSTVVQGIADESVLQIARKMTEHTVSCVVIVDPSTHFPLGIITERDITQFHVLGLNLSETTAGEVMSTPLTTVRPYDSLWFVQEQMLKLRVKRLVVVRSSGELAGIVTQTQMLKLLNPVEMYKIMGQMKKTIEEQTHQLRELNCQLQLANDELYRKASVDGLTGIPNRRRFDEYLSETWKNLSQTQGELTLVICDVDFFKTYNDIYGHVKGDTCLTQIAQALKQTVRSSSDLVARYGGEEFTIILPNCGEIGAERALENLLKQVHTLNIPHTGSGVADFVTISLGAATVGFPSTGSPTALIQLADKKLYESKQQGRNCFRFEIMR